MARGQVAVWHDLLTAGTDGTVNRFSGDSFASLPIQNVSTCGTITNASRRRAAPMAARSERNLGGGEFGITGFGSDPERPQALTCIFRS